MASLPVKVAPSSRVPTIEAMSASRDLTTRTGVEQETSDADASMWTNLHLLLSLWVWSVYCFSLVQFKFFISQFGSYFMPVTLTANHRPIIVAFGRHLTFYAVGAFFNLFLVAGESAWRPEGSSLISSTLWRRLSEMIGQGMAAFSGGRAPPVSMVIILITELMNRSDQPLVTQIHLSP